MEYAAREIAKALGGNEMFDGFRLTSADRVKATHGDFQTGRRGMLADIEPVELPETGSRITKGMAQPGDGTNAVFTPADDAAATVSVDGFGGHGINTDIWKLYGVLPHRGLK
jgi:hypothetical protein